MKTNKKAIELSLQTVVVGIVLLIVMAVVLFMFSRGIGGQNEVIESTTGDVSSYIDDPDKEDNFVNKLIDSSKNKEGKNKDEIILPLLPLPLMKRKKRHEL